MTGDCGTSDHEALAAARTARLDVIVIDHHEVPSGETRGLRAHQLAPARRRASRSRGWRPAGWPSTWRRRCAPRLGAHASIRASCWTWWRWGRIADLVPLVDENRILVAAGLRDAVRAQAPGAGGAHGAGGARLDEPITATTSAFRLTPASTPPAGSARRSSRSICCWPPADDAERLAPTLDDQNTERQRIQELVWIEALAAGGRSRPTRRRWWWGPRGGTRAWSASSPPGWSTSFARPAVAVGFKDGQGRGSARTVAGVNLYEALGRLRRAPHRSSAATPAPPG